MFVSYLHVHCMYVSSPIYVCTVSSPMYVCALPTCTLYVLLAHLQYVCLFVCLFVCLQIQMLGYDISWAAFNIIEVMSSSKFTFKVC